MNNWLFWAQIPAGIVALYVFTVYMARTFPTLSGKKILFLIAHPDDEAMFFAPALRWLTDPALGNLVIILCLSSGNADGLGHVRKGELKKSALQLGITNEEHVVVIEDDHFLDSMTADWDAKLIGNILTRYFAPDISKLSSSSAPQAGIDAIVTFDSGGVSGHPNHISLYHGATAFIKQVMQRHAGWESPVKLYALTSTNVVRKYSSILDVMVTMFTLVFRTREAGNFPTPLLTVSGFGDVWKAQRAMTTAHKSQMRWFRWGWIGVSRYMVVNDLSKVKVT